MKAKTLVTVLAATLLAGGASITCAQPAESTFQLVTELHIVPGQEVEFETINKARNARLAEGNFTFPNRLSVAGPDSSRGPAVAQRDEVIGEQGQARHRFRGGPGAVA